MNCKNLEKLTVWSVSHRSGFSTPQQSVSQIIKSNDKLKVLLAPNYLFNKDVSSEFGFKLTEIEIEGVHNEVQHQNVNLFLKTQRDTLENLEFYIHQYVDVEFMKIVLSMPRLKRFSVSCYLVDRLGAAAETLPQNHTVTHLSFPQGVTRNTLQNLIKMFPKVEYLEISEMNDEILDSMSETCKSLKSLSIHAFLLRNTSHLQTLPHLTEFDCLFVGEGFEESFDCFLQRHRNTLEILKVMECKNNEFMKTVLSLPRLHKLTVGRAGIDSLELFADSFPKNYSITSFASTLCITQGKKVFKALKS